MNANQRVRYTGPDQRLQGELGTALTVQDGRALVRFDKPTACLPSALADLPVAHFQLVPDVEQPACKPS